MGRMLVRYLGIALLAVVVSGCVIADDEALRRDAMVALHATLTESTVRIWVEGAPSGSGFVVAPDGLVATNYHVVMARDHSQPEGEMPGVSAEIKVEFKDGRILEAEALSCVEHSDLWLSRSKDFAVLKVDAQGLQALPLGSLSDVPEGAPICLAGFPLGIDQPVVASGTLSTKWTTDAAFNHSGTREVAWLDVTLNRGNSGGPVVALGVGEHEDCVVGIATFQLNPFAGRAERLADAVRPTGTDLVVPGFSMKELALLTGEALSHNSLGVGGCVSVGYLDEWLRERSN